MIINVASEKKTAHFTIGDGANFPYEFVFLDRTTGIIVNVVIDPETFQNLKFEMKGY